MNSKVLLLSVAVIAIGLFAMPSTLSLFAGQHTFYNGSEVKCEKCHADIFSELNSLTSSAHLLGEFDTCGGCHRTNTTSFDGLIPANGTSNASTFNGTNVTADGQAHAAVTMECIACHSGVDEELQGSNAAHGAFYNASNNSGAAVKMKGANVACVGCHTHAYINVTWTRAVGYDLTSNATGTGWDLTFAMNYSANVTNSSAGE